MGRIGPTICRPCLPSNRFSLDLESAFQHTGVGDGQDGPATAEAWLKELKWNGTKTFMGSQRHLWRPDLASLPGAEQVDP